MLTIADIKVIEEQIGRPPRGLVDVVVRNAVGRPRVILVKPLVDDQPFPTHYWLTDPQIVKQISAIEGQGFIKEIEALIASDSDIRASHLRDQDRYEKDREALIDTYIDADKSQTLKAQMRGLGIGGLADHGRVRCLHMFYADHLVQGNTVGYWIDRIFSHRDEKIIRIR